MTGQRVPFAAFDQGRIEPIRSYPAIALDSARDADNPLELTGLAGTMLWVSGVSTGTAFLRLNDQTAARLPLRAHTVLQGVPMARVFLDWEAQAGKSITLLYGSGVQVNPGNDISNIERILEPITLTPGTLANTGYFRSSASAALGTLVTPAANVAGIRVDAIGAYAGAVYERVMAKATAPSAWNDANAIQLALTSATATAVAAQFALTLPVIVPAGLGLYEQASGAGGTSTVGIAFEVLS